MRGSCEMYASFRTPLFVVQQPCSVQTGLGGTLDLVSPRLRTATIQLSSLAADQDMRKGTCEFAR
jgi:hypothetical protein